MTEVNWEQKIPVAQRKLIYRLAKAGVDTEAIAKVCWVTEEDIQELRKEELKKRVVKVLRYFKHRAVRSGAEKPRAIPKHQKVPTEDRWLVYRRRKRGETLKSIAASYGCSPTRIDHIAARQFREQRTRVWKYLNKRAMRPKPLVRFVPSPPKEDLRWKFAPKLRWGDNRKIRWRFKQGQTYAAIARAFHVSNSTARTVVMRELRKQEARVWRYLKVRRKRKYVWTPQMQMIEFETMRGEG